MSGRGPVGRDPTLGAAYRERTAPLGVPPLPTAGQETAMMLLRTQLGNTLRGHRLRQRRTLRDVSGKARVSLGYLSEVERGQKEASSELLASICDALDLELADLLAEVSTSLREGARPAAVRPLAPTAEPAGGRARAPRGAAAGGGGGGAPPRRAGAGGGRARARARGRRRHPNRGAPR